jgi:lipopolysaccharide export system protein LptA
MRKSEAAKYARWSAAAALILAWLTVAVYLKRGWTRYLETKKAPAAAPVDVERQSRLLTFSKVEENRKVFTVEASKSIDFKGLNASNLEGVKITIFGKDGLRHDTMETHTCRYARDSGDIACSGEVDIVLMSAEEWKAAKGGSDQLPANGMKVQTSAVSFNRASGEAKTDAEVRFWFANGSGRATGAEYHSEQGTLRLQREVKLSLDGRGALGKKNPSPAKGAQPVEVSGSRMEFARDSGTIFLSGPAEAKTEAQRLTSAGMLLELDKNFHASRLTAKSDGGAARPEFTSQKGAGRQHLAADEIVAFFAPQGWITRAEGHGNVTSDGEQGTNRQSAKAQTVSLEMAAGQNEPKLLVLKGAVDAEMSDRNNGGRRHLTTDELHLEFAASSSKKGSSLAAARTIGAGQLEWNEAAAGDAPAAQTTIRANQLALQFDASGKPSRLDALNHVRTERNTAGRDKQVATAGNGFVELQPSGGWSRMQLDGNVHLDEGQRSAQADRAVFARAEQTATLTGHATVKDASTITSAQKLVFWQATGDLRGEGGVRSTDLAARAGSVQLAPVPANLSAQQLVGNSKTGGALYSGHARLWQGDSVLEADSIELLKSERKANATGNVRAVFPQSAGKATAGGQPPALWHAQSQALTYWDAENRAHLDRGVVAQSGGQKITCDGLDLYFTRSEARAGGAAAASGSPAGIAGSQQISRALGIGHVTVQQGDRRATSERGEYTAADGKFVMTGGTPTLFDAEEGTTTGRQLTFFLADATIIVDSENGSRTLTKHRVEK